VSYVGGLACFRVTVYTDRPASLPWSQDGGDQPFTVPWEYRRVRVIITGRDSKEAAEKAAIVGPEILGGRAVVVERVEQTCSPGAHRNERSFVSSRPGCFRGFATRARTSRGRSTSSLVAA